MFTLHSKSLTGDAQLCSNTSTLFNGNIGQPDLLLYTSMSFMLSLYSAAVRSSVKVTDVSVPYADQETSDSSLCWVCIVCFLPF